MNARLVEPPGVPVCAAGPLGTSSVLRALSMQVWPAAPSGWPSAWLGPANRDSAGFSAVWPFQLGVSAVAGFGHQIPSLCRSKRITRESLSSSSGVPRFCFLFFFCWPPLGGGRLSFLSLSPMNQCTHGLWSRLGTPRVPLVHLVLQACSGRFPCKCGPRPSTCWPASRTGSGPVGLAPAGFSAVAYLRNTRLSLDSHES